MATSIKSREGSLWDAFCKVIDRMTVGQQYTIFEVFNEMEHYYSGPRDITTASIERMVSRRKIYFFTDLQIVSARKGVHTVYEKMRKTNIINPVQKKPQSSAVKQAIRDSLVKAATDKYWTYEEAVRLGLNYVRKVCQSNDLYDDVNRLLIKTKEKLQDSSYSLASGLVNWDTYCYDIKCKNKVALDNRLHNYKLKPVATVVIPELSYQEKQEAWVKENKVKLGNRVKVLHKASLKQNGWCACWNPIMDLLVTEIGSIEGFESNSTGVLVYFSGTGDRFRFPYFVLEKVEEPTQATPEVAVPEVKTEVSLDGIKTSYDTFKHALYTMYEQVAAVAKEQQMTTAEVLDCVVSPEKLVSNTAYILEALCDYEILLIDKSKTITKKEMTDLLIDLVSVL